MADLIKIMISSRCNDNFPAGDGNPTLSKIRRKLKEKIESEKLFNLPIFEVWINEEIPPQGGNWDSWDVCMNAVEDCDLLIALYNGNAGYAGENGSIGICHAELSRGLNIFPGKVRVIDIADPKIEQKDYRDPNPLNENFQKYVREQNRFSGKASSFEELETVIYATLTDAIIKLVKDGVATISKTNYHSGEALDWSRKSYSERRDLMTSVVKNSLLGRAGTKLIGEQNKFLIVNIHSIPVLINVDAIPDAMSVSPARELVGQPFLSDYKLANLIADNEGGPVHIIACHKGATESQAKKMLGFSDATVVATPFGVYVADNIQKIQFIFIANCRDEATTRQGVQRFFDWLIQNSEDARLASRAISRAKIVKLIAEEKNKSN